MIKVDALTKNFGSFRAVDNLSFVVQPGELFCLLGPNGAGKTTTIKMMTGLLKPTSGSIEIAGIDLLAHPLQVKQIVGYIPDTPFLYERLNPLEFLKFTADLYGMDAARAAKEIEQLLTLFGLFENRNDLVKDFSHGMRQRLIYCATLLHEPRVLFIDEPLMGLDPRTIRMIKDLLLVKARAGMTILLTTHILALAEDIADTIGIVSRGRMIAMGPKDRLAEQYGISGSLEQVFLTLTGEDRQPAAPGG